MIGKEYLEEAKRLDQEYKSKFEQLKSLQDMSMSITSLCKTEKIQMSHDNSKNGDLICQIIDLENELKSDMELIIKKKKELVKRINEIDNPDYRLLLNLRYLNLKTWEQIACDMGVTFQWAHRLHHSALKTFEKKFFAS